MKQYKGNIYVILDTVNMKNPVSREWVNSILYYDIKNPEKKFVRTSFEFLRRFEEIKWIL